MTPNFNQADGGAWSPRSGGHPQVSGSEMSDPSFAGTLQQILQQNTGYYVICEFFFGTGDFARREGFLYSVGGDFLMLREPATNRFILCDFYSLRFVTFFPPGKEPTRPMGNPGGR